MSRRRSGALRGRARPPDAGTRSGSSAGSVNANREPPVRASLWAGNCAAVQLHEPTDQREAEPEAAAAAGERLLLLQSPTPSSSTERSTPARVEPLSWRGPRSLDGG